MNKSEVLDTFKEPVILIKEKDGEYLCDFICEIWDYMKQKHQFDPKVRRKFSKSLRLLGIDEVKYKERET